MTNIEQFPDAIRAQFPEGIRQVTGGEVEQVEDQQLATWTAAGEDAFEIVLSNGAAYQITIRQTAREAVECDVCHVEVDVAEITEAVDGSLVCLACQEAWEDSYDDPSESPYDYYRGAA